MKDIGEFLKQKRLEKGITIEEIVDKTRMPITRIKAIEEGNITAFKDDITYLQFFIQSYCRAIGVDYQEIKEQLNESISGYTISFQSEQLRTQIETEKNIRERSTKRIEEYKTKNPIKKVERKIDFSLISFVAIIGVILVCLLMVGGSYLKDFFNNPSNEDPIVDTPIVDNEDDKPHLDEPEVPVVEKEIEVVMNSEDVSRYVIYNAEEKFIIKVEFVPNSWFELTLDGIVQATPKADVYDAGQVLEIEIDPAKNQEIAMKFGYFANNKLFVNDKEVVIDPSIATKQGVQVITFALGGSNNELAE